MKVAQLWSYPVKSMLGDTVDSVEMTELGIVGDRTYAFRDLNQGGIDGGRRLNALTDCHAERLADGAVRITLPDGRALVIDDPLVDPILTELIGKPVKLEGLAPANDLDHYRRGAPVRDDMEADLREAFGREDDEPLPDFSVFPTDVIEFASPPGTYHDCWPLMVMTTSALRSMSEALPDSVIDVRRFRPSVVVDTGDEPGHPELDWAGRRASIGDVEVEFIGRCPRCAIVTRSFGDDIPADRQVLRHIVKDLDQDVGQYAKVVSSGTVGIGDAVAFI